MINEVPQVPQAPLLGTPIGLGDAPDSEGVYFVMRDDTWLLLMVGGHDPRETQFTLDWTIRLHATGELEAYSVPPAPLRCGRSTAYMEGASTQVTVGSHSLVHQASVALETGRASYLHLRFADSSSTTDPTSAGAHAGSYHFRETTGTIRKDLATGAGTVARCYAAHPGDLAIHIDESRLSGRVYWLMADAAHLLFGPLACDDQ